MTPPYMRSCTMGIYSDILLTVDFDRTLTAPDNTIPQRNLDAIRYFIANGGAFTVNTGRSSLHCGPILDKVPINTSLIVSNGAMLLENGVPTDIVSIDLPVEQTLRRICDAFPELNVDLQGIDTHFGFQPRGCWDEYHTANRVNHLVAAPGMDYGPFIKANIFCPLQNTSITQMYGGAPEEIAMIDRAEQWLLDNYGHKLTVLRSQARLLSIQAPGVSKLAGARKLQKKLGKKILVCVGDEKNDLSMLQGADYAFCPSDGAVADQFPNVCPCAEGSIADVICNKLPEILKG